MADDKSKVGGADRRTVSASEDYEVNDFAKAQGITPQQVRDLIKAHGNDREALAAEAAKLNPKLS